MKVALVQLCAATDSAANRHAMSGWVDRIRASGAGPDLVVFPEGAMHDFGSADHDLSAVAEPLDGPYVQALGTHARRLGAAVVGHIFERSDTGLPYNTQVVVEPNGSVAATYRKIHLYDSFGYAESDRLGAGGIMPVVIDVAGLPVGLMTCYDLRFPEMGRALVDAGAQLLVLPAAWVAGALKEDHWQLLVRARAVENTVYVAAAAQCGRAYCGHSMLVDPMGVVVAAAAEAEALVTGDVDPDRLERARATNPSLRNRRFGSQAGT
ncbi:MAG: carbon-nitrogen hydrolase family protein [Actinomycetota bacterium]|nr:carbon-nitrogen hydrolase family protein [Actinomycetota bacterium]